MDSSILAPFAFLMLFVSSAAIVGSLIFGQAVYYFFDKRKKDSILMVIYSIGWIFIITLVVSSNGLLGYEGLVVNRHSF